MFLVLCFFLVFGTFFLKVLELTAMESDWCMLTYVQRTGRDVLRAEYDLMKMAGEACPSTRFLPS